jgi:penicillin amidase
LRLWQLDLQSRQLRGRLAEALGVAFVPRDHAARLFLSQHDPADDWAALDPRLKAISLAFVAGINRRVQEIHDAPSLAPPEFGLFDMLPAFWEVDDLVRVRYCGSPNVRAEFRRALLARDGALALDALVQPLEPAHVLTVPEGLDLTGFAPGQLALFESLSEPLPFDRAWMPAQRAAMAELDAVDDSEQGSNAWVISGRHTETGRPILANDPHLAFSIPGPRMVSHLSAPGFNVIGAGPVWRPGVQFGHNEHIAFGRTDFAIDQEDLYVLELDAAGDHYRAVEGWRPITRRTERVAVRGAADAAVNLAFCDIGPLIHEDRAARRALALRAVWLQPATCVALEYVPKLFATDWASFRAALRAAVWGTNYMYADRHGHIGWQAAGRVPVRTRHDGLMPVPAAGGYEWNGILPLDEMPHEFDPERGWIGSANQQPVAPNWPSNGRTISFEWKPDDRYRRVVQLLQGVAVPGAPKTTVDEQWRLQQDVLSVRAVALVDGLRGWLAGRTPAEGFAGAISTAAAGDGESIAATLAAQSLLAWDGRLAADSAPALLYEAWWQVLQQVARGALVPTRHAALMTPLHPHATTRWFDSQISLNTTATVTLLKQTLAQAWQRTQALPAAAQGPLRWGDLHKVDLRHVLGRWLSTSTTLSDGLHALGGRSGGDAGTVQARWYLSFDRPRVTGGASFRAVVDVGAWDRARAINFPGQSGDPRSPWYRNLYTRWVEGGSMPLHFDRDAVLRHSVQHLTLHPPAPAARP